MRWFIMVILGVLIQISLMSSIAIASVITYMDNPTTGPCPKAIIIRPEISEQNVFITGDLSAFSVASHKIGTTLSSQIEGSKAVSKEEFKSIENCNVPIILSKIKSYSIGDCYWGACIGDISISLLIFESPASEKPEATREITSKGSPGWGELAPFQNAIDALCQSIKDKEDLTKILKR